MKFAGSPVSLPGCVEIPHDSMNSTVAWTVSNGSVPPNSGDSSRVRSAHSGEASKYHRQKFKNEHQ